MKRRPVLFGLLALSVGSTAWLALTDAADDAVPLARTPSDGERAQERSSRPAAPPAAAAVTRWPAPVQRSSEAWPVDPASFVAWQPPLPPAPPPVARPVVPPSAEVAAPPQAPPFPLTLIGRVVDGDSVHALFAAPTRTIGVRITEVIDGQWRVEAIGDGGVTLTWLPGGQRQTIPFRSS